MFDYSSQISAGCAQGLINASLPADVTFVPKLISNNSGRTVLSVIDKELKECDDFFMSVAFITESGVVPFLGTLKELEEKGVKGKILTTDYLAFSEPKALDKIGMLNNIELRVFKTNDYNAGFHTKGYLFHNNGSIRMIVGSSNLTQSALAVNHEWNAKLVSTSYGQFAKDIETEAEYLWGISVPYSEYKEEYLNLYSTHKPYRESLKNFTRIFSNSVTKQLVPNEMQVQVSSTIADFVDNGKKRALIVSATGTGKTYASAFALKKLFDDGYLAKHKVLFLSHREQINKQSLNSYKKIFGDKIPMALLSGTYNDINSALNVDFLFSTMNMMAKDNIREQFLPDHFSVIILDECHRCGATSYQRIVDYFKPKLLLGMTASPERMDGFDVFSFFDHNMACEIRLQQALENDMLCPFHYFGITDLVILDEEVDDKTRFNRLTTDARIDYVISKAEYYGYSGSRVKGLVFCSRKDEAKELSRKINALGKYKTIVLSGENSQEERTEAIERLVSDDEREDRLDYIFTVDIFNEGVDVPEINQVIMLRPTESPIIFVQQLGRGLRKSEGKEFVVVLDFIGNYENNYMIPIALSGDRSGNKDNIRRSLIDEDYIKGASTIYFDSISRERIFKSIDNARLNVKSKLFAEYTNFKNKLGRIPLLKEYDEMGELDPIRIIDIWGSYQAFLMDKEPNYQKRLSLKQLQILKFISQCFATGKRIHEIILLKMLINSTSSVKINDWKSKIKSCYKIQIDKKTELSVERVLEGNFFRKQDYKIKLIDVEEGSFNLSKMFKEMLDSEFRDILNELLNFAKSRYETNYLKQYKDSCFSLYKKYTYADVCWLLNWEKEEVSLNIGGYKYDKYSRTYPIFINYQKDDSISATTKYEDRFVDPGRIIAISKSKRTLQSDDVKTALTSKENGVFMPLFVRKNKDDQTSKEFYFLGEIFSNGNAKEFIMPDTENVSAVELEYELTTPVEDGLYGYLIS